MTDIARPRLKGCGPAGLRAMTSGGNKDKDNDDDQGGDIPAWMFKKSNQEKTEKSDPKKTETLRRNQPRNRD